MTSTEKDFIIVAAVVGAILVFDYFSGNDVVADSLSDVIGQGGGQSTNPTAQDILSALSGFENVASQHNNPGGICGSFTNGVCNGPATFDTLEEGQAAAVAAIQKILDNNPGITVSQFVAKWSGGVGTVLSNYISHVEDALGLGAGDPIAGSDDGDDDSQDD